MTEKNTMNFKKTKNKSNYIILITPKSNFIICTLPMLKNIA